MKPYISKCDTSKAFIKERGEVSDLVNFLLELKKHIKKGKIKKSKKILKELSEKIWNEPFNSILIEIESSVNKYNFEKAEKHIHKLINHPALGG